MKNIILLVAVFSYSGMAFSQRNSSIIGRWDAVSTFTGDVYVNSENDSTFMSEEMKQRYPEKADQEKLIQHTKQVFLNTHFIFGKNGEYQQEVDGKILIQEYYKLNKAKSIIKIFSKNSLGDSVTEEIKYSQKGKILSIKFQTEDNLLSYVLKKH